MIPYGRQDISQSDIDSVIAVLKSEYLTQGPCVPQFEAKIAGLVSAKYAVAVNSATSALHLACLALDLGAEDWLWTTPISFVASANCGLYCGAKIDFVDIDLQTFNISPESLEIKLKAASKAGCLPKVLIVVHMAGQSCEMESIYKLSKEYGFKLIEDASHAIGGRYKKSRIGSCAFSDITVFSFHPVKIITTAEGGVATTNDIELAEKMSNLRSHGITRDRRVMVNKSNEPWYYEQQALGFNYRMTELQAALGLSQVDRLEEFLVRRNRIAKNYDIELKNLPLKTPHVSEGTYSAFHLYVVRLDVAKARVTHSEFFNQLQNSGIGVNLHYIPIYRQPFYKKLGFPDKYCPNAEIYYAQAVSLPIFFGLSDIDQGYIVSTIKRILN